MQISPGTQLVWSLSGSEAVNLGMPKIEPDHLYCALLKFVELSDDTITRLLNNSSDAPSVCRERDDLALKFNDLPGSTTDLRHALRKETEHGTHKLEGNLIHRSDASRKVFEQAIQIANDEDVPVAPTHLLQVLMESPTPAMKKVLKLESDLPQWLADLDQEEEKAVETRQYPSWIQPLQDLAPKRGFSAPSTSQPQIKVIAAALTASNPSPLLLICEANVEPLPLVGKAQADDQTLLRFDHEKVLDRIGKKEEKESIGVEIARSLDEFWRQDKTAWIFCDLTQDTESEDSLLDCLTPLLSKEPRLVVAVTDKTYKKRVRTNQAAEASFRPIWLHDLSNVRKVSRI